MRKILLTSAAVSALALAGPAIAATPEAPTSSGSSLVSAELGAPTMEANESFILAETDPLDEDAEDGDEEEDEGEDDEFGAPEEDDDLLADAAGDLEEDDGFGDEEDDDEEDDDTTIE